MSKNAYRKILRAFINDPLVKVLAEQLDVCSEGMDGLAGYEVGCSRCNARPACCYLWDTQVCNHHARLLKPYEFRRMSQEFYRIKQGRTAATLITAP